MLSYRRGRSKSIQKRSHLLESLEGAREDVGIKVPDGLHRTCRLAREVVQVIPKGHGAPAKGMHDVHLVDAGSVKGNAGSDPDGVGGVEGELLGLSDAVFGPGQHLQTVAGDVGLRDEADATIKSAIVREHTDGVRLKRIPARRSEWRSE